MLDRLYKKYGISNFNVLSSELRYGKTGEIRVQVCANPKPDIVWIHRKSGRSISTGQSSGNYSALPLHHIVKPQYDYTPATKERFCYMTKLLISRVGRMDTSFSVMASNIVDTRTQEVVTTVRNMPYYKSALKNQCSVVLFMLVIVSTLSSVY